VWPPPILSELLTNRPEPPSFPAGVGRRTTSSRGDGNLAWLRERNRERVVAVLRTLGRTSQADIARSTGLSRTTVSTLVTELKDSGLVFEVDPKGSGQRGGRPGVQLVLLDSAKAVVGIDFGHSHVQVAVADLAHNILAERRRDLDVDRRAADALNASADMVEEALVEAGVQRTAVICAGIGIPGPVDRARGTVGSTTILPGWIGLHIATEMEGRLGLPVEIENDANCGALAELTWGAGRDCSNFAYIKAATGIGAGLVIDGRLLRGTSGTAGEIGHTTLDESGPLCYCGNRGCLETVASGPAILALVGQGRSETLTLGRVIELAADGDVRCRRAISDAGRSIGVAVAGLCNLINPERVIVGGLLSRAGDLLLGPIRESIRRHAVLAAADRVEVVPAVFVERAELLGSLALAIRAWNPALAARA
jgi:predicted NBD/HSP70 family sugar kinase